MDRREFLKLTAGSVATLVVGSNMPWIFEDPAYATVPVQSITLRITDAVKEMITHEPGNNDARCYFWVYRATVRHASGATFQLPPECPGPNIYATQGESISITIENALDEPHSFYIPGIANSGRIRPGATKTMVVKAKKSGTYLYYDNLNAPVNRVMGLHGAFVVMPRQSAPGHKFTPYDRPTPAVQRIYDDFGTTAHWPGLAWEEGDPATDTSRFRQHIWLLHEASSRLFAEVGDYTPGLDYPAARFVDAFQNDPFTPTSDDIRAPGTDAFNKKAQYFTINGQSGHFAHNNSSVTPMHRVGEPTLVRVLNAGLHTHSLHIHANHVFVTSVGNVVQQNPLWLDTFTAHPLDTWEYTVPYMRPPDFPNVRGIGRPDQPLPTVDQLTGVPTGNVAYPPVEEFDVYQPPIGTLVTKFDGTGLVDIAQRQSPLCYPMHDHSEASQTAQGGNYNCGLISGIYFIGDRNTPGWMDFPIEQDFKDMLKLGGGGGGTGPAAGPLP